MYCKSSTLTLDFRKCPNLILSHMVMSDVLFGNIFVLVTTALHLLSLLNSVCNIPSLCVKGDEM